MTKSFSKILVAFDGSADSMEALKKAESLTKLNNAQLTVVYVDEPKTSNIPIDQAFTVRNAMNGHDAINHPPSYVESVHVSDKAGIKQVDYTFEDTLNKAKNSLSPVINQVNYEIVTGNPADAICDYAKDKNIDLIVIGNRGLSGIKKLIMGSVSSKVTNQSDCPVLIVK